MKTVLRYILSFLLVAMICITALAGAAHVLYGDYSRSQIEDKYMARWSAAQTQADRLLERLLQYQGELSARLMKSDVVQTSETDSLLPILYQILEEVSKQEMGYEEATKALVFRLVLALARLNRQDLPNKEALPNETRVDRRIGEIETFIHNHMSEMITPSDVAASIHISTKQINRILQNAFGMNTTEYIAHIKCAYAKHLLAFTDEPITDIATKIGYSSVFSFTKFFRRVEGMPPALFRRSRYQFNL